MTGTPRLKPPKNNAQWARNVEKNQDAAAHPTAMRVGGWVFSEQEGTGALIASHRNGGSLVIAQVPEASENADAVISQGQPYLKVERQQNQQEPRGTVALVNWDTLIYQTEGWGFVPTASDIAIPEDGVYLVNYHLAFLNSSNVTNKALFFVGAETKMAQEFLPGGAHWQSFYLSDTFQLNAGETVSGGAFVSGSGTMDFGYSSVDPTVFTSLSLLKLPVD